jgi:hypothetical protein
MEHVMARIIAIVQSNNLASAVLGVLLGLAAALVAIQFVPAS